MCISPFVKCTEQCFGGGPKVVFFGTNPFKCYKLGFDNAPESVWWVETVLMEESMSVCGFEEYFNVQLLSVYCKMY